MEKHVSLRKYKEMNLKNGFISCSKNISETGFIKIDYVTDDWWIKTTDNRSYSCCPSEMVYFNK